MHLSKLTEHVLLLYRRIRQSWGLKLEQLKGELSQLLTLADDH